MCRYALEILIKLRFTSSPRDQTHKHIEIIRQAILFHTQQRQMNVWRKALPKMFEIAAFAFVRLAEQRNTAEH